MTSFVARDCYTSLAFNGTSSRVVSAANLPVLGSFTYCAWARSNGYSGGAQAVMGSNAASEYPMLQQAADGTIQLYDLKNAVALMSTSVPWKYKTWVHLAVTYDSASGVVTLYVNGIPFFTDVTTTGRSYGPDTFSVGARSGTSWFNGNIDEPRVYARALSRSEIYDAVIGGNYPLDAVLAWNFDEGVGGAALPASGSSMAGTLSGTPLYSPDAPITPPLIDQGQRLAFVGDDVNDAIHVTTANIYPYLQGAGCVFMGTWFRIPPLVPSVASTVMYLPSSGGTTGIILSYDTSGRIAGFARSRNAGAGPSPAAGAGFRQRGQWAHCAIVANYSNDVAEIYVNGILAGQASGSVWEDDTYQCGATGSFSMPSPAGAGANAGWPQCDTRIGTGVPSRAEMRDWYLSGNFPPSCRLVGHWKVGPGDLTTVRDYGPNRLDGTVAGTPAFPNGIVARGPFA